MCAKFHFNCIYLKNSMEGGPFGPSLALERPKKPCINRVKKLFPIAFKGYPRYLITSQNVLSEAQEIFCRKAMFCSQDIQVFVF